MNIEVYGTSSEWTHRADKAIRRYIQERSDLEKRSLINWKDHPRFDHLFSWILKRYARIIRKRREVRMKVAAQIK